MKVQSVITLNHKTGPVNITIEAETPEVCAHLANSIKGHFAKPQSDRDKLQKTAKEMIDQRSKDLFRSMGLS